MFYISSVIISLLLEKELKSAEDISFKTKIKVYLLIFMLYVIFSLYIILFNIKNKTWSFIKCLIKNAKNS